MVQSTVEKFRKLLEAERVRLLPALQKNRVAKEEFAAAVEKTHDDGAGALALEHHSKEVLFAQGENAIIRFTNIKRAVARIDRGEYGECIGCGEDIAEKRLLAIPWAALCIVCQERSEQARGTDRSIPRFDDDSEEEAPAGKSARRSA